MAEKFAGQAVQREDGCISYFLNNFKSVGLRMAGAD